MPAPKPENVIERWRGFLRGGYPEMLAEPDRDAALWHLERDVRRLRQVGDLTSFRNILRALEARTGQLLNLSDVARDPGVAVNTAEAWLSVLERPSRGSCCGQE